MSCKVRRRRISVLIASLMIATSLVTSSCSLGSMPSRTKSSDSVSDTDPSDSIYSESVPDTDISSESEENGSVDQSLRDSADQYMAVLQTGDLSSVMDYFRISFREITEPMYECYEQVFRTLFKDVSYDYGSVLTSDYNDFDLSVTCKVPDIDACVDTVLSDEAFMNDVSADWVKAIVAEYNSMDALIAYEAMRNNILLEALRRIEEGEFTDVLVVSGSFRFHDNSGENNWLCTRTPDFVRMCANDYYMPKLVYIDPQSRLNLIIRVGSSLAEKGDMDRKALDTFLEEHSAEILDA